MIETAHPTLAAEASRAFNAYLARPSAAGQSGVVILSDMFGFSAPMRAVAERCAGRGFAALLPNLFWRSEIPGEISYEASQHEVAWARLKALDFDAVTADMRTAVAWLKAQPFSNGKVAAVGFCGGGRFAYLAAARAGIDAAASLYGLGISQHLGELGYVKCPLQLHYGLQDQHVPQSEIDAVAAGVRGHAGTEVFLYPKAGHSFANPVRPTYDAAAAALAWSRIDAMLGAM
jgi:carboxymethylenebutenolidase